MITVDKNKKELRTGQIVKIENGFFKSDNGIYRVAHSPKDENWTGTDFCLKKVKKVNGKWVDSKAKYSTTFFPLYSTTNNQEKKIIAKEHNDKYATIEIIDSIKMYKIKRIAIRGCSEFPSIEYLTEDQYSDLNSNLNYSERIEILEEIERSDSSDSEIPKTKETKEPFLVFEENTNTIRQMPENYLVAYNRNDLQQRWICDPDIAANKDLATKVFKACFDYDVRDMVVGKI